jgi:hypothetical protein
VQIDWSGKPWTETVWQNAAASLSRQSSSSKQTWLLEPPCPILHVWKTEAQNYYMSLWCLGAFQSPTRIMTSTCLTVNLYCIPIPK